MIKFRDRFRPDRSKKRFRSARRDSEVRLHDCGWKTFGQLPPSLTAIDRFENAAAIAVEHAVFPRSFARFPQRCVNDLRIAWINLNIARADVLIAVQHLFECFAAVERSINATLFVRSIRMAGYGNKDAVRSFWINCQLRDLLTIAQSQMRPSPSGIRRFVNTVAD